MSWSPQALARADSHQMRSALRQRGVAAVVFLAIFAVIMLGVLTTAMGGRSAQNDFDAKTFPVLAAAKEALIAYAAANPNVPGRLPCPDTANDGMPHCSGTGDQIGRLPWKALGLPDLRDGSGECLWYAVSGNFAETATLTTPINSDTDGHFKIVDDASPTNNTLTGSTSQSLAIAVIFAPGPAFDTNDRSPPPPPATQCGGSMNASNYLDTAANGVNNATLVGTPPVFVVGAPSPTFNDRLVYITPKEFFPRVERRIAAEIKKALQAYAAVNSGAYPFANNYTPPYNCTASNLQGLLPRMASSDCVTPAVWLPSWLTDDMWHTVTYYAVDPGSALTVLNTPAPNNNKHVLVIMAGRELTGQTRPCAVVTDCLEGPINPNGPSTNIFESKPASPTFNDIVVVMVP